MLKFAPFKISSDEDNCNVLLPLFPFRNMDSDLVTLLFPSEPATFLQRLPNVFQTSLTFGIRWVVVAPTSRVRWILFYYTLGSRCTAVACSLGSILPSSIVVNSV